jgi:anti-anti-sigma factor
MLQAFDGREDGRRETALGDVGRPGAVELRVADAAAVVTLVGEHDLATAAAVEDALRQARLEQGMLVAVDLERCTFIASYALRPLFMGIRQAQEDGSRFVVVMPDSTSDVVRRVVEMSGLGMAAEIATSLGPADARRPA